MFQKKRIKKIAKFELLIKYLIKLIKIKRFAEVAKKWEIEDSLKTNEGSNNLFV